MRAPWMLRAKNNDVFKENKRTAKKQRGGFCQLRWKSESEQQSQSHSAAIKEE